MPPQRQHFNLLTIIQINKVYKYSVKRNSQNPSTEQLTGQTTQPIPENPVGLREISANSDA